MVTMPAGEFQLEALRLSLIWHQNLMPDETKARPLVLDLDAYDELFNSAPGSSREGLRVPWPEYQLQGFWEKYLGKPGGLSSVSPRNARRALLPLRTEAPLAMKVEGEPEQTGAVEGFLHNWGASLIVTFPLREAWNEFAGAADRLVALRHEKILEIAETGELMRLDDLATSGLERLRKLAKASAEGPRSGPFSICTLISAAGKPEEFHPGDASSEVSRFLHAATSFRRGWREDQPAVPADANVAGFRVGPAAHLVYGSSRARAIWSPTHFLDPEKGQTKTLGCHHRNLVLASMQTEALGGYAQDTSRRIEGGVELSSEHKAQADSFCSLLKQLYDGAGTTYQSGSVKAQISDSWLTAVNSVCELRGLPELS